EDRVGHDAARGQQRDPAHRDGDRRRDLRDPSGLSADDDRRAAGNQSARAFEVNHILPNTSSRSATRCFSAAATCSAISATKIAAVTRWISLMRSFSRGASNPQCGSVDPKYLIGYFVNDEPRYPASGITSMHA